MDCFLEVLGDCTDQKVDNVVDGFMMALKTFLLITKTSLMHTETSTTRVRQTLGM